MLQKSVERGATQRSSRASAGKHIKRLVCFGTAAALTVGTGFGAANAVHGTQSNATGQYLNGSLLDFDLGLLAELEGVSAHSDGHSDQTVANNLDLSVLGLNIINIPGGLQLPLDLDGAGVVHQYASALSNGSSVGASGLTSENGAIGDGITPAPGVAPGPISLSLSDIVSALGLDPELLDQVAELDLVAGVTAGRASQAAPFAAEGSYSLADIGINFQSDILASLVQLITDQVAEAQAVLDGLSGPTGAISDALGILFAIVPGLFSATVSVEALDLQTLIDPLLTGEISDPSCPGVVIDLDSGSVSIDLGEFIQLEGLPPNTHILTPELLDEIADCIETIVTNFVLDIIQTLEDAILDLDVDISATVAALPVLTVDSTIGQLLDGDTSGISILGAAIGLVDAEDNIDELLPDLSFLTTTVGVLLDVVVDPVVDVVLLAVTQILALVLDLVVNVQSLNNNVFSETALQINVLPAKPDSTLVTLNLGNATVGPNVFVPPTPPAPTPGGSGAGGGAGAGHGGLAKTGSAGIDMTALAGALMLLAAGASVIARRRKA